MNRFTWAAETLAVKPSDHVLEIGCGHGLAAALVGPYLKSGNLVGIDRSPAMIVRARQRNQSLLAAGKVVFEAVALKDFDAGRRQFSKIFAINVNLFWTDPVELPIVDRMLNPGGILYLFYQPPSAAQCGPMIDKLTRNLAQQGLIRLRTSMAERNAALFCVAGSKPARRGS